MEAIIYIIIAILILAVNKIWHKKIAHIIALGSFIIGTCTFARAMIKDYPPIQTFINILIELITDKQNPPDKVTPTTEGIRIDYSYDFVNIDGYPIGKYSFEDHPIAKSLMSETLTKIKKACDTSGISYNAVKIEIVGTADGIPARRSYYLGDIGDDIGMQYIDDNGILQYIQFEKGKTLMNNLEYAAIRAYLIEKLCKDHFGKNNPNINTRLHCFKEKGPEYRKVTVSFTIEIKNENDRKKINCIIQEHAKIKP